MRRPSYLVPTIWVLANCAVESTDPDDPVDSDVTAVILPAALPATVYNLAGRTSPAAGAIATNIDTRLTMTFDGPPALGAGTVQIFRRSDDALVDTIKIGAETDAIGFAGQDRVRRINVERLLRVSGNTLSIVPHHAKLAYATTYYVGIETGVVTGAALNGKAFNGIGKAGAWSFTTKAAPAGTLTTLVVNDDGVADFRTVQGALDHVMKNVARDTAVTISVRNGTYEELLFLRGKNNVRIVGESRAGVTIQYRNFDGLNRGTGGSQTPGSAASTGGRAVFLMETADLVTLDTLTLKNTMVRSTTVSSQAETIYFNNDSGRLIAKNANFLSEQDTVLVKGYSWFFNSLIAGNVDFIWGGNRVALFENCEIRSVGDTTNASSGGFIVQARTVSATDKGFVFVNSRLTHGPGPGPAAGDVPSGSRAATYLARSPGTSTTNDNVAYVNCQMDTHIIPRGWAFNTAGQPIPNPSVATAVSGWREFGTRTLSGAAVNLTTRIGGHLLSAGEVAAGFSNRAQIFAAFGGGAGWNPQP
jgi:pectin methylesterase-like acyl-CoA thioesterase